jgi:hypothetical protein
MTFLQRSAILICCLGFLSGCGGDGKVRPRGQVLKGGAPFTVPEGEYVRLTFHPIVAPGQRANNTYVAEYNRSDGRFTVVGPDGNGLPPGKYRVAVEHERKRRDLFKGAYDAETSPFVFDVNSSRQEIVIDLGKKS